MGGGFWGEYKATDICNQKSLGKIMSNEVLESLKYTWYIEGNGSKEKSESTTLSFCVNDGN